MGEDLVTETVYGDYNQDALVLEYDMRRRCPHFAETFASMELHSARTVARFESRLDVPLRRSYLDADLRMDEDETRRNSPVYHLPAWMPPMVVAVGGGETDEFRRQSRVYTDACRGKGFPVSYLEVGDFDHVQVAGEYRNRLGPLTAALFARMGLS